eukprot:4726238-Prymnesium_polylepis.1
MGLREGAKSVKAPSVARSSAGGGGLCSAKGRQGDRQSAAMGCTATWGDWVAVWGAGGSGSARLR